MDLWFAALLGVVQGLTEFLPISSTAHLRIVPALLGREDPGAAFTAVTQLGTLLAVVIYFLRDLGSMTRAVFTDRRAPDARLAAAVVVGSIPIAVAGVLLKPYIVGPWRSLYVVAAALIAVGVFMWLADRAARQARTLPALTLLDALLIGAAQACALIPGVSRSGATLTAALLLGLRRDDAARFSFLLSIPAVAAAGIFELRDAAPTAGALPSLAVATAAAAVSGYATIAWLLRWLRTRTLLPFSIYRLLLGLLLIALLYGNYLMPL